MSARLAPGRRFRARSFLISGAWLFSSCDDSPLHWFAGPVGQLVAARRAGATHIVATDLSPFTLRKALAVGADEALAVATALGVKNLIAP